MFVLKCISLCVLILNVLDGQIISNVNLINNIGYMTELIQETVTEIENRHWSNLKLEDHTTHLNESVFGNNMTGTVKYTDGFVNTIQHINVLSNSLQQIWSNQPDATVGVQMTGQLRMIEVGLGWDIHVDVDGHHFYTGVVEIPIIYFDFSVFKNMHTHEVNVSVAGTHYAPYNMKMSMLPVDTLSDKLMSTYNYNLTTQMVNNWATDVMQPIANDRVMNKLDFPGLCYDCSVAEANEDW